MSDSQGDSDVQRITLAIEHLSEQVEHTRADVSRLRDAIVGEPTSEKPGIIGRVAMVERDISEHRMECSSKAGRQQVAFYSAIVAVIATIANWFSRNLDHK